MFKNKHLTLLLLTTMPMVTLAQDYYRWIDSDGKLHFSQNPPPDGVSAEIEDLPLSPYPSDLADRNQPAEQTSDASERLRTFRSNPETCAQIEQNLAAINQYEIVVMTDTENGEAFQLSEAERESELGHLENMREYYCE